jgi:hypothetical protein
MSLLIAQGHDQNGHFRAVAVGKVSFAAESTCKSGRNRDIGLHCPGNGGTLPCLQSTSPAFLWTLPTAGRQGWIDVAQSGSDSPWQSE